MKAEIVSILCAVAGFTMFAMGCHTKARRNPFAPYIAQKESGAWHYRIDNATGVTHESAIGADNPAGALMLYDRFSSWLSAGCDPIMRSKDGREWWSAETAAGETIDCAEQDFATPSAARANFRAVKNAILFHPSPRVRRDVKL